MGIGGPLGRCGRQRGAIGTRVKGSLGYLLLYADQRRKDHIEVCGGTCKKYVTVIVSVLGTEVLTVWEKKPETML